MKPLDIVTVVGSTRYDTKQATPVAPGLVLGVTEIEGRKPSLRVVTALDGGGDLGLVAAPLADLPHMEDDPAGNYRWREYDPADFAPADATTEAEPAGSVSGGQADSTPPA